MEDYGSQGTWGSNASCRGVFQWQYLMISIDVISFCMSPLAQGWTLSVSQCHGLASSRSPQVRLDFSLRRRKEPWPRYIIGVNDIAKVSKPVTFTSSLLQLAGTRIPDRSPGLGACGWRWRAWESSRMVENKSVCEGEGETKEASRWLGGSPHWAAASSPAQIESMMKMNGILLVSNQAS